MNVLRELRKLKTKSVIAKIRVLILLIVMLTVSTYAWFYTERNTNVGGIRGEVIDWDIEYSIDDEEISTEEVVIAIDEFYPGMADFEKNILTLNKTEIGAEIRYELKSVKIFGEEKIDYLKTSNNITIAGNTTNIFSKEEYPFNVGFTYDKDVLAGLDKDAEGIPPESLATLTIFANWSYERTGANTTLLQNDKLDTNFGERAYNYYKNDELSNQYSPLEIVLNVTTAREGYFD